MPHPQRLFSSLSLALQSTVVVSQREINLFHVLPQRSWNQEAHHKVYTLHLKPLRVQLKSFQIKIRRLNKTQVKYRVTMNNCSKGTETATNITLLTLSSGLDSHLDGLLDKCRH